MSPSSNLRALRGLAAFAVIFSSAPAQAILDTNNNSISDLFERQFNSGNLLPNTFLATNDNDKDGWSNAKEAIAGTNPFDPNPPDGIVALTITPSLIEGSFTLTWNTLVGKNYQLKVSSDLINWSNLEDSITTTQNTHIIGVNTTQPDTTIPPAVFWQITVTDLDTDNDGLTNSEEHQLGTNPQLADSDGDTLNDKAEILAQTNPLHNDTDLDGIPDNIDTTPLTNNIITNPDYAGLSPALLNGLTSLWDFETLQTITINGIPSLAYANLITPAQPALYYGPIISNDGLISRSAHHQAANHSLIAAPQAFSGKTNWTVSLWYKITQGSIQNKTGTINTVLWAYNNGNGSNNNDTTPEFQVHAYKALTAQDSQKLIISHYHNGTLQPDLITYIPQSNPLDNDTWQHLTITKNTGTIKLYRNAVLLNQFSTSAASYTATSTGYFAIGRLHQATTADTALRGKLDRFTIHNRALSATEVTALVDLDSDKDGLFDRTEIATKLWRDANSNGIQDPGETTFQNDPSRAQPNNRDTDGDGLTDIQEQTLGTGIATPDSDGDLMPDGWEVLHNLNPPSASDAQLDNDTGGPDGLTNLDEYRHNSDPKKRDTDDDGILDGPEAKGPDGNLATDDGSNPNDASDNGARPPADQLLTLKLGVGDRSGSHSEDYVLHVFQLQPDGSEKRIYTLRSGGFGQYTEQNRSFPKTHSYTFQIDWQSTNNNAQSPGSANAEGADFDYHLVVEPLSGNQGHILIDSYDPRTKTADSTSPLLDPQDINPTDDDDDDVTTFLTTHEPKRVAFVTLHLEWKVFSDFENLGNHVDPWTDTVAGKMLLPDYKNPTQTTLRNTVFLEVSGGLPGLPITVKSFDIDDSTSEDFDKDFDTLVPVIDTNGRAGMDNQSSLDTSGNLMPKSGQFLVNYVWSQNFASELCNNSGVAKFQFRTSTRAGDNYRACADVITYDRLNSVTETDDSSVNYISASVTPPLSTSEPLTLWRQLWIENDSMEAIPLDTYGYPKNDLSASLVSKTFTSNSSLLANGNTMIQIPLEIDDTTSFYDLENGKVIAASNDIEVVDTFSGVINLLGNQTHLKMGDEFRLYDDDGYGMQSASLPITDAATKIGYLYKTAFIKVHDAGVYNPNKFIPFYRNHPVVVGVPFFQHAGIYDDTKDLTSTDNLWVANLIFAYQGDIGEDKDPFSEDISEGGTPSNRTYSVVFTETIRDAVDALFRDVRNDKVSQTNIILRNIYLTAAHEIGHMPGSGNGNSHHLETGLMNETGYQDNDEDNVFGPESILRFRNTNNWQQH